MGFKMNRSRRQKQHELAMVKELNNLTQQRKIFHSNIKPPQKNLNESDMRNTIFVPKLKHQQLLDLAIVEDRKQTKKKFNEALKAVEAYFNQNRWWLFANEQIIYDRETGLLWENLKSCGLLYSNDGGNNTAAKNFLKNKTIASLGSWQLPTKLELIKVSSHSNFLLRKGAQNSLLEQRSWCVVNGVIDLYYSDPSVNAANGYILAVNSYLKNKNFSEVICACAEKGWTIKLPRVAEDEHYKKFQKDIETVVWYKTKYEKTMPEIPLTDIWKEVDYISTRLPVIDNLCFTDIGQGMWEFYAPPELQQNYQKISTDLSIRARNPELDIKSAKVGIDFGTSSTVVAVRANGRDKLLRIGLQEEDFKKHSLSDNDFENPTILEFLDIQQLIKAWHGEAYRPLIDWDTVHCSHEARTRFRNNDSDPVIVGSIFARLKQWALRDIEQAKVRLTDSKKKHEYEFNSLNELNPIKGRALSIHKDYPELDPIELYAWFLGMNINSREHGIHLKYYMTFPVAYPIEVKDKILSSFRRGLQRSLPESLIYSEKFNELFEVKEEASEPAAFAASALNALDIEPTEQGTAYAVFDFGGGTTDFDYGIYRLPNTEEYEEGWDDVIEHFGSSGDKFLGGENLLENLAYQVFKYPKNQEICREKEVSFTKPLDAHDFAGSERLIAKTQAAYTNTTLLMSKLRPLWENGAVNQNSEVEQKLTLLNRHGQRVDCAIKIPQRMLIEWLQDRIREGLKNFFIALEASFKNQHDKLPEIIHILLAGNSSRSRIVLGLLGCLETEQDQVLRKLFLEDMAEIFSENKELPQFIIHEPLQSDENNPYAPTTKTGVALGLLRVSPGETLLVINHAKQQNNDSPFQYFVGTHRRNIFSATLKRGDIYEEWKELGAIRGGMFPLLYTTQAQALNGIERGTNGLVEENIEFSGSDTQGKKVFAKIISPNSIELGIAANLEQIGQMSDRRTVILKVH